MVGSYDIILADQSIGSADVFKEGLYYRFRCRCCLSGEVMYQLMVVCGDNKCSLGICVPIGDRFGIDTKIPIKKIGEGQFSFFATPRHSDLKEKFVPIRADEPFQYIEKLQNLHLEFCNGEAGVFIEEDDI